MNRGKDYTGSSSGGEHELGEYYKGSSSGRGHESGERLHGQRQRWRA